MKDKKLIQKIKFLEENNFNVPIYIEDVWKKSKSRTGFVLRSFFCGGKIDMIINGKIKRDIISNISVQNAATIGAAVEKETNNVLYAEHVAADWSIVFTLKKDFSGSIQYKNGSFVLFNHIEVVDDIKIKMILREGRRLLDLTGFDHIEIAAVWSPDFFGTKTARFFFPDFKKIA